MPVVLQAFGNIEKLSLVFDDGYVAREPSRRLARSYF